MSSVLQKVIKCHFAFLEILNQQAGFKFKFIETILLIFNILLY